MQWRDDTTLPSQGRVGGMTAWGQTLPSRDLLAKVALHIVASGVAQCSWAVFLHRPTTNSSLHLWMTPASGPSRAIPCRQCARLSQHRRQPDWAAVMPNPDFRYTPEPVGAPSRIITQSKGRCFPSDPHLQKSALRMSRLRQSANAKRMLPSLPDDGARLIRVPIHYCSLYANRRRRTE
jgi:hypothetical protein